MGSASWANNKMRLESSREYSGINLPPTYHSQRLMRQFARLTLSGPSPEDVTIINFQYMQEINSYAPPILAVISD